MRILVFKGVFLSTLMITSLVASTLLLSPSSVHANALTPRLPIYINENDNFTPANGVNGGGSGIWNDPYIIENWEIDASSAHGIHIRNTTAYFIIRNCVVENGRDNFRHGIYLANVVNGRIENNICENNFHGINLYYSNNNLISYNTCGNNNYGICLNYSDNNLIENNIAKNNTWRGISLYSSDNNLISNNTVGNNGTDGIYLEYSDNNLISYNTCENNNYGIRLRSSGNIKMRNNTLSNNLYNFGVEGATLSHFVHDIDNSNLVNGKPIRYLMGHSNEVIGSFLDIGYLALVNCDNIRVENIVLEHNIQGILIASTQDSRLENCKFENNGWGIYLWSSENNTLTNNTCENNESDGIYLAYSDSNMISGNTCENNESDGIYLGSSDNNLIENNIAKNNTWRGISLYSSDNNLISNNTVGNNGTDGICLDYSDNNLISGNTCENNYYGIYLDESNNNTLINNTCSNNNCGIYLGGSSNNTLENNVCENNSDGIFLSYIMLEPDPGELSFVYSNNNILTNNTCENNNEHGIYLEYSDNNLIYHNDIINNSTQAYDTGTNTWDNGYPSGGNYWSDYAGLDENHGVNQNIPGSDGIGDVPYNIFGGSNQDRYPLIVRGVQVSISPSWQENENGGTLEYEVLVMNLGNVLENFQLTTGDNASWTLALDNAWLLVPNGGSGTTKLTVTIPTNATGCTWDNIWVKATSKDNNAIFDNESCLAHVKVVVAVPATIDIDPNTLNLKSKGKWITCYIELPLGYSVENINVSTVKLTVGNNNLSAELWPTGIGDYDNDGIPDLMVKFSRSAVQVMVSVGYAKMTVTGMVNGIQFEGWDNIRVIGP